MIQEMDPKSRLGSAIQALVEGDTESAVIRLTTCQKLFLQCNEADGVRWSEELLQSTLSKSELDKHSGKDLFSYLVRCFDHETTVESSVALAASHMAGLSQSDGVKWLMLCSREANTDYLKFEAAIALGNLLFKVSKDAKAALRWFQRAKELARACKLDDWTAIASYCCGQALLALNQLGEGLKAVEQDGTKFNAALACMLEAQAARNKSSYSLENTIAAFTKARTMLVPFMPDLHVKLKNYLGKQVLDCCSECLLSFLSFDRFTDTFIENCSRFTVEEAEEALQIERAFFIYELYRVSRLEMIEIQAQVVPFEAFMDPRPYLEHGIELVRSEDSSLALEQLIICQQVALRTGHTSAFFWASGYIDVYCEKQGKQKRDQEMVFMQLVGCFQKISCDDEDVEAWGAYYAGRAGKELNRQPDVEMLKLALERSKTSTLRYYATLALGDASEDVAETIHFYELSKCHALCTGKEDLIISALLHLFGYLRSDSLGTAMYESAEGVRQDLLRLNSASKDPRLGQAVERYMEGVLLLDYQALESSVSILKSLPRVSTIQLYHPYLANGQGDTWSADMNFSAQTTYSNAVTMLATSEHIQGHSAQYHPLYSLESERDAVELRNCFFMNWILRIDNLFTGKNLEEAEAEAADMLCALEELDKTAGLNGMFGGLVRYYVALICQAYQREQDSDQEYTFNVVIDEFFNEATNLWRFTTLLELAHGAIQALQGRSLATETLCRALNRSCLQLERNFGWYSVGRIRNLENMEQHFGLLQQTFWFSGETERALIWEERKRTRDLLYILKAGELEDFDTDDVKAWLEFGSICEMIGTETVVFVMTQAGNYLFVFIVHSGTELFSCEHFLPDLEVPLGFPGPDAFKDNPEGEFHVLSVHYDILIKPFDPLLELIQPERIIFVPSKDLWYFPFNALLDRSREDKRYLVERYITSSVSSLRLLKFCEERRRELEQHLTSELSHLTSLVVGNPTLDLQEAVKEAEFVADMLKEAGFRTVNCPPPEEATKEEVLRLLPVNDWIHFATHADADEEFPEGALFLAAESDGEFGSLAGDELQKKLAGALKASVVVLSACKSGVGRVFKGEGVLALPRAFHACRVPSAVVSLWEVPDTSAPVLMKYFYTNLASGMDVAQSLREAVLAMLHEEDQWEEPAYDLKSWAPFVVSGSPFTRLIHK